MAPILLTLFMTAIAVTSYFALQMVHVMIPDYLILLLLSGSATVLWFNAAKFNAAKSKASREILSFLLILTGAIFALWGFVLAPLPVQLAIAVGLFVLERRYLRSYRLRRQEP